MYATLDQLKTALGITDGTQDALLTTSLAQMTALINAYLGADLSNADGDRFYDNFIPFGATFINLPVWPVLSISSFTSNGQALTEGTHYDLLHRSGSIFINHLLGSSNTPRFGDKVEITYKAGYPAIPEDLLTVALNLAATAFNNGGTLVQQSSGGTGELKSLTMFDAMSMSFDVGGASSSMDAVSSLLSPWYFVLNKYSVRQPVLK